MPGKTNINLTIFLVSAVLFSISCSQRNQIHEREINEEISVNAAGIKEIPVGLKAMVRRALPDTTFNVWIPGGSFRNSSLVRVSRFPEKINAEKNQNLELEGVRDEQISAQLAVISSSSIQDLRLSLARSLEHVSERFYCTS
jgi:hypothetical protein